MNIKELKHIDKPHVEMACPLCGQPSTHVVNCRGCRGGSFGHEFLKAYGEDAPDKIRAYARPRLMELFDEMIVDHALRHAWSLGGCMVCSACWHHTSPLESFVTCPLYIISEMVLEPEMPPRCMYNLIVQAKGKSPEERGRLADEFNDNLHIYWCDAWNTTGSADVARWRARLLRIAFEQN